MARSFKISSYIGVGPLRFGMSRDQVRSAMAAPFDEFSRVPGAEFSDHFPSIPAFAYYSPEGGLQAVEFAHGASVNLGELNLNGAAMAEIIEHLALEDPNLEREPTGCISKASGIGLWSDGGFDLPAQSVIVFARGYYG